jgi:PAS domain S-box-containing protein
MISALDEARDPMGRFQVSAAGRVLTVNATALGWLGYTKDELVGRPFHAALGGGGQFFFQSQILPMLALKGNLEEIYLRVKDKRGVTIPVLANAAAVDGPEGIITFAFLRIPQRGRLEDELVQAKRQAEQASDAKTKFLGMMSHELRTPLQTISLINQALLEGAYGELTPEQKEGVKSSEDSTTAVALLIDDILNFSRMQGGQVAVTVETLPVERALVRAEVAIRHRFNHARVSCVRGAVEADLSARYDANRLQQILLNLLGNALKFTPAGGSVTLSARREEKMAAIEVTDTGCGIAPDQFQKIFEPFVQLRATIQSSDKPGVGLGLAICKEFATAMGGSIGVASMVGVGSTFTVRVPLGSPGS